MLVVRVILILTFLLGSVVSGGLFIGDTSGDGINDFDSEYNEELYPNASVTEKDVYVEVHTTKDDEWVQEFKSSDEYEALIKLFDESPVDDGQGVNIHFIFTETNVEEETFISSEDYREYNNTHFENDDAGYYHLLLVDRRGTVLKDDMRTNGFAIHDTRGAVVQSFSSENGATITQNIIAHEMGHLLGISSVVDCVDSRECDLDEYNSVMNYNYNSIENKAQFGSMENHDDWKVIEDSIESNHTHLHGEPQTMIDRIYTEEFRKHN